MTLGNPAASIPAARCTALSGSFSYPVAVWQADKKASSASFTEVVINVSSFKFPSLRAKANDSLRADFNPFGEHVANKIEEWCNKLRDLRSPFLVTSQIRDHVLEQQKQTQQTLDSIERAFKNFVAQNVQYDDQKKSSCSGNTRADILANLESWAKESSEQHCYWITGPPGSGKSTLATTAPEKLFHTLTLQLAQYSPSAAAEIKTALCTKALGDLGFDQAQLFLLGLLKKVADERQDQMVLIVADASDEIGDKMKDISFFFSNC
ncbi:hypothetical protein M422DRAFT_247325 [Sphaerobolus stellatus SS14]|nr:hypothetical protein M422DRAFT_247325 [Sphaerobolus stellatus SS14]